MVSSGRVATALRGRAHFREKRAADRQFKVTGNAQQRAPVTPHYVIKSGRNGIIALPSNMVRFFWLFSNQIPKHIPGGRSAVSSSFRLAARRLRRPAALWPAAVLLALVLAGCQMAQIEAAKQQPQTPAPEAGEPVPESTPPGQPDGTPVAPVAPVAPADGPPALAIATANAAEGDGVLSFTVSLSGAAAGAVTVAYETEDGTAKAGADYQAASGLLTFPAESTAAQPIEVRLLDDEVDESGETLTVRLSDPQGATLATATATGTIQDDDARALAVEPPELYVTEGEDASYKVRLGSRPTATVTVTVSAADAAELTIAPERLVFPAQRWREPKQVTLTARQDEDALADAPVELSHTASGGGYDGVSGPTLTVTIVENDVPTLAMAPAQASEQAGRISFAVTLSQASEQAVTVNYATSGDTATEGQDYTPASGTLRFPAQSTAAQTVAVTVTDDSIDEDTETFTLTLSNATNAQLAGGGATLTAAGRIEDDDALPGLSIGGGSLTEGAGGGMRFEVRLDPVSGRTVTVQYGTADVTGRAGSDYTAVSGTLTFGAGAAVRTVTVPIADDALDEPEEQFTVTLRAAAKATVATATGTGTITDNDDAPELSVGNGSLTEGAGDGRMAFAVRLDAESGRTVTVQYRTADGSATAGTDYTAVNGTLTFRAGTTLRTVAVPITDDGLDEPEEEFTVTLGAAANATVATATGTGTIADNDAAPELSIADGSLTEGSGDGTMLFVVQLDPASQRMVTVQYATADGTAEAGTDYTSANGTLTISAGTATTTIDVTILDDTAGEETETFTVTLNSPSGATLADASATGTITDDGDTTSMIPETPEPPNSGNSTPLELSSLAVTGGGTMYPAFVAGTLHYALTCNNSPTLSVSAATDRDGATLTLLRSDSADNVESTSGSLSANVTVTDDNDVAIEVSDDGRSKTYVVHCLPDSLPTANILTKTAQVKDGLMLLTPAYETLLSRVTFMAVLDNNGVPRFHRQLTTLRTDDDQHAAMDFKYHGSDRFSVNRRPQRGSQSSFGDWQVEILDDSLAVTTSNVTTVSPLTHTDGNDFHITSAGDYVLLAYHRGQRDFSPYGGSASQTTRDSVIQRRTSSGTAQFTWNSWDHRDTLQVGNDCRVGIYPNTYAHLNGLQVLSDGDYVASFRGCAQVLRIDGTSGAVEWKLGGTAPPDGSTTEFLELVEHSDPTVVEEFCGQHHVTLTSSNTVVMYDNGVQCIGARKDAAPFSRAVEYDISSGTQAAYLREYQLPATQGYFPYRGGVHVLEEFGGSVHWLIAWGGIATGGMVAADKTIAVSEVDPVTGTVHLEVNLFVGSRDEDAWTYRAYRIPESEVDIPLNLP